MQFREALQTLIEGHDLDEVQATGLMAHLVSGEAPDSHVAAALAALAAKGATGLELASFARVLRACAVKVGVSPSGLVDTCGTGGGVSSFNLSTAAAIVAAASGARVAKHGNRAVTSACGSADVLEALGVELTSDPARAKDLLDSIGIVFLLAPAFHPALKAVGPVRRELGVRTVFNQLGPLANPAGVTRQVVGVYDPALLQPTAEALRILGCEFGLVVHGDDGMDEVSPSAPTSAYVVRSGRAEFHTFTPGDFGIAAVGADAVAPGEDPSKNAELLHESITDPDSPRSVAVIPSAAAAIWVSGLAANLAEAAEIAKRSVASGAAVAKLDDWIRAGAKA